MQSRPSVAAARSSQQTGLHTARAGAKLVKLSRAWAKRKGRSSRPVHEGTLSWLDPSSDPKLCGEESARRRCVATDKLHSP